MGGLSNFLGINPIDQNFNYQVQNADYDPNQGLLGSIQDLRGTAGRLSTMGGDVYKRGMGFLSGSDPMMQQQRSWLTRGLQDVGASQAMNLDRSLSMRGMGSGGIRDVVGQSRQRGLGEQLTKGLLGIAQFGVGAGTRLAGLGMQGMQGAGGLYGSAGGLQGGIDTRQLQANIFNTGQTNQQRKYSSEMNYRQAVENRNQKASFANSLMSGLFGLGGQALGGHMFGKAMGAANAATGGSNFMRQVGASAIGGASRGLFGSGSSRGMPRSLTSGSLAGTQPFLSPTNPSANILPANNTNQSVSTQPNQTDASANTSSGGGANAFTYAGPRMDNSYAGGNLGDIWDSSIDPYQGQNIQGQVRMPSFQVEEQRGGQRDANYGTDIPRWLTNLMGGMTLKDYLGLGNRKKG